MQKSFKQRIFESVRPGLIFISLMWLVFFVEFVFQSRFNDFGILPRTWEGLRGVLFSPFLHGDLNHLWSNTIPALCLITGLRVFYRKDALHIFIYGLILTGICTWLIGRNSYHIGASGIIYMLASFLIFKGLFMRRFKLVALSLVVIFFYGSMVWYVLPIRVGMSWEGHLSGFISGLLIASLINVKADSDLIYSWQKPQYKEEEDPFMKHFDESGNFIEIKEEE
ncbi:rhomboid family intramembrane serine protease [Nonlabens spongiae]|uniref:Rhomboid family intramembrane serine protease n=1 Tax=Nonlabens spongiae TaxID=331648 RepID=A0A1W6MP84_9FLAO|nr:rhomboid family intramembrane serine protease [Nonlabens spongiae]ARN79411.1 rhomboid family intramembrane serine protease [Nonlabens spongiae]